MPLYEYHCSHCSTEFTLLQSLQARPSETICPHCSTPAPRRLFSSFASKAADGAMFSGGGGCAPSGCGCHS